MSLPVGTVRIRHFTRTHDARAFVKVAQPNTWRLRAHVVWIAAYGPIPAGHLVHHADRDKLNDAIENLELMTKAAHLAEHRAEFSESRVASFTETRRAMRWSTKSATKRTGAPPTWSDESLAAAIADVRAGRSPHAASARHGIPRTTLYRRVRGHR